MQSEVEFFERLEKQAKGLRLLATIATVVFFVMAPVLFFGWGGVEGVCFGIASALAGLIAAVAVNAADREILERQGQLRDAERLCECGRGAKAIYLGDAHLCRTCYCDAHAAAMQAGRPRDPFDVGGRA